MTTKRPPEWRRSLGLVSVAVFAHENTADNGATVLSRTINCQRRYYDKQANEWKSSTYLSPGEIGAAISLLQAAQQYLIDVDASAGSIDETNQQ